MKGNLEQIIESDLPHQLANEHVDWLMDILNQILPPLLKVEFIHGYKHGIEEASK
jgi:hypothetical protein